MRDDRGNIDRERNRILGGSAAALPNTKAKAEQAAACRKRARGDIRASMLRKPPNLHQARSAATRGSSPPAQA